MKDNERHIIQRILRGETALYEHFLNTYGQQVFILVARIVSNQEDAEELTQDVFLKAFQHLSSFKGTSSFSTWIYSIAYNTAISNARKKKIDTFVMDDALLANISDTQVDEALNDEREEQIARLSSAMEQLNSEERALISLFYYEEKPLNEIAIILGLTESNAKVKLHRIRKKNLCVDETRKSMNEELKDRGLKKAVREQTTFRLPSNFTYRTMQKVEEAIRLREKKSERRILLATIAAAIFLIGVSGTGLVLYFGDSIREAFTPTTLPQSESIQIPCFYLLLILTIPLFILFDRWMRKLYFKHHTPKLPEF